MAMKRMMVEIGMGTDIRGADYTKAAVRALRDALWHNSLNVAAALGKPTDSMFVEVLIGVRSRSGSTWTRCSPCCRTAPGP
jgi:uncharacterized protein (TIGR02058 family)